MTDGYGYTLNETLTQQALIQSNSAATNVDQYGASLDSGWETPVAYACRTWWTKSDGVRSADRTYVGVNRQVPVSSGGMILPSGAAVSETDRVQQINQWDPETGEWVLYFSGPLEIVTVLNEQTHIEIAFERIQLGG